jgi:N-dimethylarginine dimethylaminohydrolase
MLWQPAVLMCSPRHYGIEYEINPWMRIESQVVLHRAWSQWRGLVSTYERLGVDVQLLEPIDGLPDMVFSANAAVLWQGRAVLSRFRHNERKGEETYWAATLEAFGYDVKVLPGHVRLRVQGMPSSSAPASSWGMAPARSGRHMPLWAIF